MLTEVEREHLFLLGLGQPPEARYQPAGGVTPRLQRVLDALAASPALVRTPTWDVVAWNAAASAVLTDYGALLPPERNVLRLEALKGQAGRTVRIRHQISDASCGVTFQHGTTALVFANRGRDGTWSTSLCSAAGLIDSFHKRRGE